MVTWCSFTNPRGGRGYGEEHAKAIYDSWGDRDYADLMAWHGGTGWRKEPYIEKIICIGVTGGSYAVVDMTLWVVDILRASRRLSASAA